MENSQWEKLMTIIILFVLLVFFPVFICAWSNDNDGDRVILKDVGAITLHHGQMTTGRRNNPVQQLKCVGGSAAGAFTPAVVQCKNVGSDGFDAQWECKADMDDSYRFGRLQVSCEGYDYPNDPYVLKGSCGLEYTIDYTNAGRSRSSDGYESYHHSKQYKETSGSWFIFILIVFAIGLLIYNITNKRRSNSTNGHRRQDFHNYPRQPGPGSAPPPYGFKPEYTAEASAPPPSYEDSTTTTTSNASSSNTANRNNSGFWSGLGLGSLAGYFFGSRNNYQQSYGSGYGRSYGYGQGYSSGWGRSSGWGGSSGWGRSSGWGGSSGWGRSSGSSSSGTNRRSGSSGTSRTASGFGGTSRR